MKTLLELWHHPRENVTVGVVEEVDDTENDEAELG
jgi:hypothetical protein